MGAVSVARGTRWGNPWIIRNYRDAIDGVRIWAVDHGDEWDATFGYEPGQFDNPQMLAHLYAVERYREWIKLVDIEVIRHMLGGKDLMCWCPPELPCHADVLLEIANGESS